ncbi:hypothetical protein PSTG_16981 [Puccinia striiformis f. sp. tritici PST-78]|uniref:No apical meristem-associated C-terminal domain-containing protein n=1 Tax=Puccinia striiformis f. sp. tritici PST-78 TaxID=1165861 RepID=A0A0L0UR82_9BASI|nr:hypothetical protein PSTG_16981 [Puccinia striiformis f. sp. tritici PST-78]
MSENPFNPMLDHLGSEILPAASLLGSDKPPAASPTRTYPRKRKADPEPALLESSSGLEQHTSEIDRHARSRNARQDSKIELNRTLFLDQSSIVSLRRKFNRQLVKITTLRQILSLVKEYNKCSSQEERTKEKITSPPLIPKKNWSIDEDKALCTAWLETTRDPVVGTGQKSDTFWERIHKYYAELVEKVNKEKKNLKSFNPIVIRSVGSVECRWGHILKFVNKFIGFYSQCEDRLKSGHTRDQILSEAKEMLKNQCKTRYNLDHCYVILKEAAKFKMARDEVNA